MHWNDSRLLIGGSRTDLRAESDREPRRSGRAIADPPGDTPRFGDPYWEWLMSSRDDVFAGLVEMIADAVVARIMEPPYKTVPGQKRLVTVKEAATYMGCSPRTIRRLIDGGRLERVGTDRFIRIDRVDLDRLIDHSKDRAL